METFSYCNALCPPFGWRWLRLWCAWCTLLQLASFSPLDRTPTPFIWVIIGPNVLFAIILGGTPFPNMWFWVLENYQEIIKLAIFITQMTFKPQSATLIKPTTNWRTPAGLVEITFFSKSRQTVLNSAEEHFSAQLQKQCDRTLSQEKEVGKYREM